MSRSLPFSFQEVLTTRELNRLPDSLKITGEGDPEVLLIVRLLSGALLIEHKMSSRKIDQKTNYFSSSFGSIRGTWGNAISKKIGEEVDVKDFSDYIGKVKHRNRAFFKNVLLEFCNYELHSGRKSHTSAFLYIYRVLEKIAYAFPLIYVSLTDDFTRTFGELKTIFIGDGKDLEKRAS